jgi:ferric-chelate reductase
MVLGLIHTIPFFYQNLAEGGYQNLKSNFSDFYYYSGVPPLVLLILLCTLSKASIRKRMYEGFWHLHWIMGAGYFATLTWHTTGSLGSYDYMWSALAFWASQVIYRILIKTAFKPNALFLKPSEAKLFKLKGSTGYQVNVANRAIKWRPGQHVYLRFKSKLLDNHPFSVANLPDESSQELKFIIIPKRGLTKVLYDKIDSVLSEKVYLDGPYGGSSRNHHKFENVYLLASGSGVTATVGFLTDLADKILSGENNITQVVNFVWIVRRHEDIDWFRTELLKAAECKAVNITIYVASEPTDACRVSEIGGFEKLAGPETKMSTADNADATEFEELLESRSTDGLGVLYEKPNVSRLISSYRFRLGRRNFFVSSGSDSMKMQVSAAVSDLQPIIFNNDLYDTSVEEIYLHTESFGW